MPRPKFQRFGEVVVTRYRGGACEAACNRVGCRAYARPDGWRRTVRLAREHAAAHAATDARDVNTPWGRPAHELPRAASKSRGRLAAAAVLLLAVLAFGGAIISAAGRAGSTPVPSTTTVAPVLGEYIPTPAGPPSSSSAGGDR